MRADLAWPTSGKGRGYHPNIRPILSALLELATCQAQRVMAGRPMNTNPVVWVLSTTITAQ